VARSVATEVEEMSGQSPNAGSAGAPSRPAPCRPPPSLPITFQPTLMPRSAVDHALVTGISTSLN